MFVMSKANTEPSASLGPPRDKNLDQDNFQSITTKQMPHRIEPYLQQGTVQPQPAHPRQSSPAPSSKRRRSPYDRPASSPPIAMPTHSGSPSPSASSLDRSPLSAPPLAGAGERRDAPSPSPHHPQYDVPRGYGVASYMYAPPPPHAYHDNRYAQHPHYAPPVPLPIQQPGYVPSTLPETILSAPWRPPVQNGGQQQQSGGIIQVVHTDDAATKLSEFYFRSIEPSRHSVLSSLRGIPFYRALVGFRS
ncbi:hypothetical protein B0H10DRAFT_2240056 [Mycena sp. CBHHK59/15]|nr:hypothetical protein B0H10DRAFT_2240056 [Mycena sp. CBHHK59/15]